MRPQNGRSIGPQNFPEIAAQSFEMIETIDTIETIEAIESGKLNFESHLRLESDEKRDFEFSQGATRFRFYAYIFE